MRVAITGYRGQLGGALHTLLQCEDLLLIDLPEHDFTDPAIIDTIVEFSPDVVIHPGAYTDVEGCARDPDQAFRVNGVGTQLVALACQRCDATMVYVSTNEVFDGWKGQPYLEWDQPHPINPYGASKLAGEVFTRSLVRHHYIVRITWLFAAGGRNFPSTIMRAADRHGQLRVVVDEIGSPTYAPDLAQAIQQLTETGYYGTYHLVNEGICSRHLFALRTLELSGRTGVPVEPITINQYPRLSTPPLNCVLRNFCGAFHGITLRPWEEALQDFIHTHRAREDTA